MLKVHISYYPTLFSITFEQLSDFDALTWSLKLLVSTLQKSFLLFGRPLFPRIGGKVDQIFLKVPP